MKRYQIDITFCDGSNPWLSLPLDEKETKHWVKRWLKYQKDNIKIMDIHNRSAQKKVHYNPIYGDFEVLNSNNTLPKDYRPYKTIETALKHCI